ncbi:hypothetical protein [Sulfuriferula nivalis]|nr:hypothetical protein [Sulfuriferula nivalis]
MGEKPTKNGELSRTKLLQWQREGREMAGGMRNASSYASTVKKIFP